MEPQRLRFSYYTAGSGGVGPTIMATSMLLAGEPVVAFKDGKKVRSPAFGHQGGMHCGCGSGWCSCSHEDSLQSGVWDTVCVANCVVYWECGGNLSSVHLFSLWRRLARSRIADGAAESTVLTRSPPCRS